MNTESYNKRKPSIMSRLIIPVFCWGIGIIGLFFATAHEKIGYAEQVLTHRAATSVTSRYTSAPVLSDIDDNGSIEIVIGDLDGERLRVFDVDLNPILTQTVESGIRATVAVGNLDNDSTAEIVFGTIDGYLHAYNHDGTALPGFPVLVATEGILSTPALTDIDGDDEIDITFVAANGRVYVYEVDGTPKWTESLGDFSGVSGQERNGNAVVADIDGDDDFEIIAGSYVNNLFAFDHLGNELWSFATGGPIYSTPLVMDADPETAGLESIIGSGDGKLYMISKTGTQLWQRDTGATIESSPIAFDLSGDGFDDIIIGNNGGDLLAYHDWGTPINILGWPVEVGSAISAPAVVADADQNGLLDLMVPSENGQVHAWQSSGREVSGWPITTTFAVIDAIAVEDIDEDPNNEIIAADFGGNIHIWGVEIAPSATPTNTPAPTNTPTPTHTPTATSSATAIPSSTATPSPEPTKTATATPPTVGEATPTPSLVNKVFLPSVRK